MSLALDHPALFGVGPRGSWLTLRALHTITTGTGWARYVAADDRAKGRHVLDVGRVDPLQTTDVDVEPVHHRLLLRDEVWHYAVGYAHGKGDPGVVEALLTERPAQVITAEEAAQRLGITLHGFRYYLQSGRLYPLYVQDENDHRTRAHAYAAQVNALVRRKPTAEQRWQDIRAQLPDQARVESVPERVVIRNGAQAIPPTMQTPYRQREALVTAVGLGWVADFAMHRGTSFTVQLPDGEAWRIPTRGVEAAMLGLGDALGALGRLVAYREGLG